MRVVTVTAAALLVGTMGFAVAQTGTSPGTPSGASTGQCWDVSSNQVRSKAGGSSNTASNTGSSADKMGSGSSTGSTVGSGATGSGTAAVRPAGMPNC